MYICIYISTNIYTYKYVCRKIRKNIHDNYILISVTHHTVMECTDKSPTYNCFAGDFST